MKAIFIPLIAAASAANFTIAQAEMLEAFNDEGTDVRDYFIPDPDFYRAVYNYHYLGDRLNNDNGARISSLKVNTLSGSVSVNAGVNIDTYALIPAMILTSPYQPFGARYGGTIAPFSADNGLDADYSIATGPDGSIRSIGFGIGDLYVQPVWLDWAEQHWDLSLAFGFSAPVGNYNVQKAALPGEANVNAQSRENFEVGYWTQRAQAGVAWYPMTNKATAVTAIGSYDYNSDKEDPDIKPGQIITLNWGVSQYLPLSKNHKLLLELGPAGYDSYQITDSTGANTLTAAPKSRVHAAGGQLGLTYLPWNAFLRFHGFYEFAAGSRFQGVSIGLNFGIKF